MRLGKSELQAPQDLNWATESPCRASPKPDPTHLYSGRTQGPAFRFIFPAGSIPPQCQPGKRPSRALRASDLLRPPDDGSRASSEPPTQSPEPVH